MRPFKAHFKLAGHDKTRVLGGSILRPATTEARSCKIVRLTVPFKYIALHHDDQHQLLVLRKLHELPDQA